MDVIKSYLFCLILLFLSFSETKGETDTTAQQSKWEIEAEQAYQFSKKNLYSQTDSVMKRLKKCLPYCSSFSNYINSFNVYNVVGIGFQLRSKYDSANYYFEQAKSIAQENEDVASTNKAGHNLGLNSRYLGKYEEALSVFLENLDTYGQIKEKTAFDSTMIGNTLAEIGNVYILIENRGKALEYVNKTIDFQKQRKNDRGIGNAYNSLTYLFIESGSKLYDIEKAEASADSAIKYTTLGGSIYSIINAQSSLCTIYGLKREFSKAVECNERLIDLNKRTGNSEGILVAMINSSKSLTNLLKHKKASDLLLEALTLAEELKNPRYKQAIFYSLSINHYNLNQFEKAYKYADSSRVLKEKLHDEEIDNRTADLEAKYQLLEKERTILVEQQKSDQLAQEKKLADLAVEKRTYWIIFLIILSLLLSVAAYLIVQNNKKRQKLKEAQILQEEKQRALAAVIEAQEEERKRIAKDLHDSIGQKMSGLKLGWNRMAKEIEKPELGSRIATLSDTLNATAEEIRAISHKMMPVTLQKIGISAALQSMLQNTFQFSKMTYTYDQSNAEGRFDESVEITLYRIGQELVNNAIKHAKAKEINVQLLRTKEYLVLIVQDDGEGVDLEALKKGHGFMNIDSRLSINNGEINLESTENQGLFAQVRIRI